LFFFFFNLIFFFSNSFFFSKKKTSPGAINEEHKQLVIQLLGIKPLNDVDLEAALKMPINESIKKVLTEVILLI